MLDVFGHQATAVGPAVKGYLIVALGDFKHLITGAVRQVTPVSAAGGDAVGFLRGDDVVVCGGGEPVRRFWVVMIGTHTGLGIT